MRYGDGGRYGDGSRYGEGDDPAASTGSASGVGEVAWIFNIKWDGVTPVNEADHVIDCDLFRGSENYIPPNGNGFEEFDPGKCTIKLSDPDRRYDEYNTDSPLYGYLVPGRPVEIFVRINATGVVEPQMSGFITDITQVSGENEVTIVIEDELRSLKDRKYKAGVEYGLTISQAISGVLANVNYTKSRAIGSVTQPVYVFDPGEESALDIINDLASAALGTFYCDRRGTAVFQPRSSQEATIHQLDQSQLRKTITFPKSWETVRTLVKVRVNRRGKRPGSVIWTMPGAVYFSTSTAGEYHEFSATWEKSASVTQPQPHADFYANSQADGNGNDVTDDYSVTISEITSTSCVVRITRASAEPGYLLNLRLCGAEIVTAPYDINDNADPAIINFYGSRDYALDNPWLQDSMYARWYAALLRYFLSTPHKNATVEIHQRPDIQYNKDLMHRVHLTVAARGIDITTTIRGIRHQWQSDNGQDVITTLYLQDRIYDTTVLTTDPWIPGAIETPVIPYPETPPIDIPVTPPIDIPFMPPGSPLDPTNFCLMTDAPTNGAYHVTPTISRLINDGSGSMESFLWYPCTLRPKSCVNKSTLVLSAGWAYWTEAGVQTVEIGNSWWHVDAIAADKSVLCSGVVVENNRTSPRTVTFSPDTAMEVAGFRIWIDPMYEYSALAQIGSGTIPVTSSTGATITGLTIGNYYSVEGDGGPAVLQGAWGNGYAIDMNVGLGWAIIGGNRIGGSLGYLQGTTGLGILGLTHRINTNYSRGYFKAGATLSVRVSDNYWDDNSGSLNYILRSARVAGKKSIVIWGDAGLKNVCGSGIL
jgi:hypothetical protein